MPNIPTLILAVSAIVAAIGVLWRMVLRPFGRLIGTMQSLTPLMGNLITSMADTVEPFSVLNEIVHEFRTNSGSTLRDTVNRLEGAAEIASAAAATLATTSQMTSEAVGRLEESGQVTAETLALVATAIEANKALNRDDRKRLEELTGSIALLTEWRIDRQKEVLVERRAAQIVLATEEARQRAAGVVLDTEYERQRAAGVVLGTEVARQKAAGVVLDTEAARQRAAGLVLHDDEARQTAADRVLKDNRTQDEPEPESLPVPPAA